MSSLEKAKQDLKFYKMALKAGWLPLPGQPSLLDKFKRAVLQEQYKLKIKAKL